MADSYEQAAIYLGTLDTVFMICYSIGLFVSGYLGKFITIYFHDIHVLSGISSSGLLRKSYLLSDSDCIYKLTKGENYSQRLVLSLGTLLNAISLFIFGCVLPWMNCTSFYIWVFVWVSLY